MIDAKVIADVRHVAARVSHRLDSPVYQQEDVEQSLLLAIVERAPKRDSGRVSARTWAALVVRHEAAAVIGKALAKKRDCRVRATSLSEPIATGLSGETAELESTLSADACAMRLGRQTQPEAELRDLQIDIEHILAGVRPDVAQFARLLTYESVIDAARSTGISRATAHRHLQKLRTAFAENGLDTYLTRGPAIGSKRREQ